MNKIFLYAIKYKYCRYLLDFTYCEMCPVADTPPGTHTPTLTFSRGVWPSPRKGECGNAYPREVGVWFSSPNFSLLKRMSESKNLPHQWLFFFFKLTLCWGGCYFDTNNMGNAPKLLCNANTPHYFFQYGQCNAGPLHFPLDVMSMHASHQLHWWCI
jgi:hypothetical protein